MSTPQASRDRPAGGLNISLVLCAAQAEHVMSKAAGDAELRRFLLTRLDELGTSVADALSDAGSNRPNQSRAVIVAISILAFFLFADDERRVSEAAAALKISSSTTHRYIQTLLRLGLLEQNHVSRKYRLATQGEARTTAKARTECTGLPDGRGVYDRVTILARQGVVEKIFRPLEWPAHDALDVCAWLAGHGFVA